MKNLRWWMIALLMVVSIINYLTRSTLGVAAPAILRDLHITAQQYSWIVGTFQGAIMLQPICGYVLDVVGLKTKKTNNTNTKTNNNKTKKTKKTPNKTKTKTTTKNPRTKLALGRPRSRSTTPRESGPRLT